MHLPYCRFTVRRTMATIVVFAACLAAIQGNYQARLYSDTSVVKILSVADRTPERMAAHARRLVSPEILSHASLDPRLSGLHQPLRAGDREEVIGSSPGPQVYAHVNSVKDGTLWVESIAEESAVEATSIALAVTDAYIADLGANRVVPWTAGIPMRCEFRPKSLAEPRELAAAVALAVLASALVLVVPTKRLTIRRLMAVSAVVGGIIVVGRMNEFEASLFFAVCYFVVPPTLVVMILRSFDPARPRPFGRRQRVRCK